MVTFIPLANKLSAISIPINPPPMTTAFLGFLVSMKFFILSASGISRRIKTFSA